MTLPLMTGCAGGNSEPQPAYLKVCPVIVEYPRAFQLGALDDASRLPSGSPLRKMLADYEDLRDQARRCAKG